MKQYKAACLKFRSAILFPAAIVLSISTLAGQEDLPEPSFDISPSDDDLQVFVSMTRMDILVEKATILADNLMLTEEEAETFWPLYADYTNELYTILDKRLAILNDNVDAFEDMTDAQAKQLANDVFNIEENRLKLKRQWFKKISSQLSPKIAAQFFQIENQLNAVVDLQIAASLPLIQ